MAQHAASRYASIDEATEDDGSLHPMGFGHSLRRQTTSSRLRGGAADEKGTVGSVSASRAPMGLTHAATVDISGFFDLHELLLPRRR